MKWPREVRFSLKQMMWAVGVLTVSMGMFASLFRHHFALMPIPISWGVGYLALFVLPAVLKERWQGPAYEDREPRDEV